MNESPNGAYPIDCESDIVATRKVVRDVATNMGFSVTDVTRIVTAASELTRNIHLYAGRGTMRCKEARDGSRVGLELVFEDHGPGIADIEEAMRPGFSSGNGLGLGLPGSRRLTDEMTIDSKVGRGTTVTIRKWLRE